MMLKLDKLSANNLNPARYLDLKLLRNLLSKIPGNSDEGLAILPKYQNHSSIKN